MSTHQDTAQPKALPEYVKVGVLVNTIGMCAETWRDLADHNEIRSTRRSETAARFFHYEDCRAYMKRRPARRPCKRKTVDVVDGALLTRRFNERQKAQSSGTRS